MIKRITTIAIIFICTSLLIAMHNNNGISKVSSHNNEVYADAETNQDKLWPVLDEYLYENGDCLAINFYLDPKYSILDIAYEIDGFVINLDPEYSISDSYIYVEIIHSIIYDEYNEEEIIYYSEPEFNLYVQVAGGGWLNSNIYAFSTEYGLYISPFSSENAKGKYEEIWALECEELVSSDITTPIIQPLAAGIAGISGKLTWKDSADNPQKLKNVKVELRKKEYFLWLIPTGSSVLATTYTDSNGDYSFTFANNKYDVFIRVYAEGKNSGNTEGSNVGVYKSAGLLQHYFDSDPIKNMPNISKKIDACIKKDSLLSNAFQVCQTIITGAEYVYEMHDGYNVPWVTVNYPSIIANNSSPSCFAGVIRLPSDWYDWDTVLHEYGHHIGYKLEVDDHPGRLLELQPQWPLFVFDYSWSTSLFEATESQSYSKSQSIRLAWGEAWAEYFSRMVRHYYWEDLDGIPNVMFGVPDKNINEASLYNISNGEASIRSIENVLWSVYRDILNSGRDIDTIFNGNQAVKDTHKIMWDTIIEVQSNTTKSSFSTFANYFREKFPEHTSAFGKILMKYGMAPIFQNFEEYIFGSFTWQNSYLSPVQKYPYNKYEIIFFDRYNNPQILLPSETLINIDTKTINLTDSGWRKLISESGENCRLMIIAYQNNKHWFYGTCNTGGYNSEIYEFTNIFYNALDIRNIDVSTYNKILPQTSILVFIGSQEIKWDSAAFSISVNGIIQNGNTTILTDHQNEIVLTHRNTNVSFTYYVSIGTICDVNCHSNQSRIATLNSGSSILYKINLKCSGSYRFQSTADSAIHMTLYDDNMNLINSSPNMYYNNTMASFDGNFQQGTYYLNVSYANATASGDIMTTLNSTQTEQIWVGSNKNVLIHQHDGFKRYVFYNNYSSQFVRLTLATPTSLSYPEGTIVVKGVDGNILEKLAIEDYNNPAYNQNGINSLTVFLPYLGAYYIEIYFDTTVSSLTLNLSSSNPTGQSSEVDLFNLPENMDSNISSFDNISKGDEIKILELKQAGKFNLAVTGLAGAQLVILKEWYRVDGEIYFQNILLELIENSYAIDLDLTEGTYYIGYFNADSGQNINFSITRKISQSGAEHIIADPITGFLCGTEVSLNGGIRDNNTITQGFTRLLYLNKTSLLPSDSREDYYWYSSKTNVATVTPYGTILALSVIQDTSVKIMAVYKRDPSIVFVKEFIVKKDVKTINTNPLIYNLAMSVAAGSWETQSINLSSILVPINLLQHYRWSSNNPLVSVDIWGRIYAYPASSGQTITITGNYKFNSRVIIYITVTVV